MALTQHLQQLLDLAGNKKAFDMSDDVYRAIAAEIERDMKVTAAEDPTFKTQIGHEIYSPLEIAFHVSAKTPLGMDYLDDFVSGLRFMAGPVPAAEKKEEPKATPKKKGFLGIFGL